MEPAVCIRSHLWKCSEASDKTWRSQSTCVWAPAGRGQNDATLLWCPRLCVLSYTSAVSFALTPPCIMHDTNANTAIVARVKSLSGLPRPTGKPFTGFICNSDLLPARVIVELQAQDSCQSLALNCLLHQWIIDKVKLSTVCFFGLNGIMLIAGSAVLSLACYWRGNSTFPIPV